MIPIAALIVALSCALASARRVWLAANATALHPELVVKALTKKELDRGQLRAIVLADPDAEWERELFSAMEEEREDVRAALVNEQLTELDWRLNRWGRVPRVCASLATSAGLLLATLVLRQGLSDASALSGDLAELVVRGLVGDALTVAGFGIVGTVFCISAQGHAKRIARARSESVDRLIAILEAR